MDMKELHLIETDFGSVVATTHISDLSYNYIGTILNLDVVVSADTKEDCINVLKNVCEINMKRWLKNQLINTGICCEQ